MNKNIEARAKIVNVDIFREKLKQIGAKSVKSYSFTDYLFQPKGVKWDFNIQSMKVREYDDGRKSIKYHLVEWVNNIKQDKFGFVQEISSLKLGFEIMRNFNFEKVAEYSRKGEFYKIRDSTFVLENIDKLGWFVEVESESFEKVDKILSQLGLKKIDKSIPKLIQESLE